MSRLLLRPGWIVTHLVVIAIAVLFVNLGLWQLERNAERQVASDRILQVQQLDPIPLEDALTMADPYLRPVQVIGTFLQDDEVRLTPRSRNEIPGFELLTPLVLADGETIIVNRGWAPLDTTPPPAQTGTVGFIGRVRQPATARQVLPLGADRAEMMSNVDTTVLARQVEDLLINAYVEVVDEDARLAGALPRPAEPAAAEGSANNLSYAFQWFAFVVIGLIGYPLLLRRRIADASGDPDLETMDSTPDDEPTPTVDGRETKAPSVSK